MSSLILSPVPTSPREDAIQLYRAFKGFGCDTEAVIKILAHRDSMQRALIQQEYNAMYSTDLLKKLVSELRGKLETAVLLWMHEPASRDAIILNESLSPDFLNLEAATELICTRTVPQLQTLKQLYYSKFETHIERDIELQTIGDHQKILLAYLSAPRYQGAEIDRGLVAEDAKALFKAGEKKLGTNEKVFVRIFSERSPAHLIAVSSAYHDMYGNSLNKAVKSETSGKLELALLSILGCAKNPYKYFAKVLNKAMKGLGTDDTKLIRVIVTRTEIDMQYIKAEYLKKYGKTLNDEVQSETSGHYRTFLLALLGPKNH
ncbi:hypothetical protein DCAR_0416426 [Daucus carota subsp. sativus]|uniref:Annexin n=1 Tax=Daucus carota subsp. sativus TaxID=79200 RepID=A0A165XGA8_DAUCS|nr:PREDICTED: annexin D5-like [Daucus carota subsp. sativus]WOG97087.1 hypothetical protein DCAR_0416426 [Daucus carota subsp. sativus]